MTGRNPLADAFASAEAHPDDLRVMGRIFVRYSHTDENGCMFLTGQADQDQRPFMCTGGQMNRIARLIVAICDDLPIHETWKWDTRHTCGNAACCNPEHLTSGKREENMADRHRHGTMPVGERHGLTTFSDKQALEIERAEGTQAEIAARCNTSATTVGRIQQHEARLYLWGDDD